MAQEEKTGVPEKHSLQPPTRVALGTVSEGWAGGGLLQLPCPAQRPPQAQRLQPASFQVRAAAGPPEKGTLPEAETNKDKQVLAIPWEAQQALQSPNSQINPKPSSRRCLWAERFTAGQGKAGQDRTQARHRPYRGRVSRRPSNLLVPSTPALLWELIQDDRSLIWPQPCPTPAVGFGRPFGKSPGPCPQCPGQEKAPTWGRGRCEGCGPVCP